LFSDLAVHTSPEDARDERKSDLASQARRGYLSSGALELERYVELGAIGLYFSFGV
jgi:hypothetical protein